ncbi:hypothetical protein BDZ91DRAFT_794883 [Kalaharituber pfeilii]|nr:hypothetical protein BDZ91DRAFT_794883 [Kalaharituber pfeilii]
MTLVVISITGDHSFPLQPKAQIIRTCFVQREECLIFVDEAVRRILDEDVRQVLEQKSTSANTSDNATASPMISDAPTETKGSDMLISAISGAIPTVAMAVLGWIISWWLQASMAGKKMDKMQNEWKEWKKKQASCLGENADWEKERESWAKEKENWAQEGAKWTQDKAEFENQKADWAKERENSELVKQRADEAKDRGSWDKERAKERDDWKRQNDEWKMKEAIWKEENDQSRQRKHELKEKKHERKAEKSYLEGERSVLIWVKDMWDREMDKVADERRRWAERKELMQR